MSDKVYWQRNRLVAMLARIYPSKVSWEDEKWPCVYIELPTGQVSFHIPNKESLQLAGLPTVGKNQEVWDGHDDNLKWARTRKFILSGEGGNRAFNYWVPVELWGDKEDRELFDKPVRGMFSDSEYSFWMLKKMAPFKPEEDCFVYCNEFGQELHPPGCYKTIVPDYFAYPDYQRVDG